MTRPARDDRAPREDRGAWGRRPARDDRDARPSSGGGFAGAALAYKDVTDLIRAIEVQDEFVAFVNAFGPQEVKRVSKLDVAFEKQLKARDKP